MTMEPKTLTIIFPHDDLKAIISQYMVHAGAVTPQQLIRDIDLPIEVNDDGMIECRVGVLESEIN